jgi:DNA adenine methylase
MRSKLLQSNNRRPYATAAMRRNHAPIIRWAGSKRASVSVLLKFCGTKYRRYVEPFCGSAAVYFSIEDKEAILSDINHHLINFYRNAQSDASRLYDRVVAIPRTKKHYYRSRDEFNECQDGFERACLFYYLNKNCFNGLFRTAKNGNFNVPYSRARVGNYQAKEAFLASAQILQRAQFFCGDFETVLLHHVKEGDLVYLDPPYSDAKRYPFREYFPGCFAFKDINRMVGILETLDKRGAHFVLSFSSRLKTPLAQKGWITTSIRTRRNISGFASARKYVNDIIVTNRPIDPTCRQT